MMMMMMMVIMMMMMTMMTMMMMMMVVMMMMMRIGLETLDKNRLWGQSSSPPDTVSKRFWRSTSLNSEKAVFRKGCVFRSLN